MNDHPQRERIARELHARPFISLQAPVRLLHLSMLDDGDGGFVGEALQGALCGRGESDVVGHADVGCGRADLSG